MPSAPSGHCCERFAMVYFKTQGHFKMVVPAKARQRLRETWRARIGVAFLLLAGMTVAAVQLGAQHRAPFGAERSAAAAAAAFRGARGFDGG